MIDLTKQMTKIKRKSAAVMWTNLTCTVLSFPAIVVLVVAWITSMVKTEWGFVHGFMCIVALLFVVASAALSILLHCKKPSTKIFFIQQLISLIAFAFTAITLGMGHVTLYVCRQSEENEPPDCALQSVEVAVEVIVCFFMALNYLFTQQCVAWYACKQIVEGVHRCGAYGVPLAGKV
ncbi:hypothetical protein DPX39_080047000 [Trypanosoma brucei equiperdum]|uniref:Uncharacterized protein n=1 Tax=Trypanosoma brucei equiperdum TaxID=630700 RepID=A0A3L6L9I7_9TRYP|nr:hypothetical protein DPX39_080047000 [Trypanosoma brucei equiperdum]